MSPELNTYGSKYPIIRGQNQSYLSYFKYLTMPNLLFSPSHHDRCRQNELSGKPVIRPANIRRILGFSTFATVLQTCIFCRQCSTKQLLQEKRNTKSANEPCPSFVRSVHIHYIYDNYTYYIHATQTQAKHSYAIILYENLCSSFFLLSV